MPPKPKKLPSRVSATGAVEALRTELHAYHLDTMAGLTRLDERLSGAMDQLERLDLSVNGSQPASADAPGLTATVHSLTRWRDRQIRCLKWGIHATWAVAIGIVGLVVSLWQGGK
jgi:hypothetical protein